MLITPSLNCSANLFFWKFSSLIFDLSAAADLGDDDWRVMILSWWWRWLKGEPPHWSFSGRTSFPAGFVFYPQLQQKNEDKVEVEAKYGINGRYKVNKITMRQIWNIQDKLLNGNLTTAGYMAKEWGSRAVRESW